MKKPELCHEFSSRIYIQHKDIPEVISFKQIKGHDIFSNDEGCFKVKIKFNDSKHEKTIRVRNINDDDSIKDQIKTAIGTQDEWDENRKFYLLKILKNSLVTLERSLRTLETETKDLSTYEGTEDDIKEIKNDFDKIIKEYDLR